MYEIPVRFSVRAHRVWLWNSESARKFLSPSHRQITESLGSPALILSSDVAPPFVSSPASLVPTGKRRIVRDAATFTARLCGGV